MAATQSSNYTQWPRGLACLPVALKPARPRRRLRRGRARSQHRALPRPHLVTCCEHMPASVHIEGVEPDEDFRKVMHGPKKAPMN